jgi:hypothetical protein
MRAGDGVSKWYRKAQLEARVAPTAFHHVARAEFLADGGLAQVSSP